MTEKIFILEKKIAIFCECKVAAMAQQGRLYRDNEYGDLWYSERILPYQDLEMQYEQGNLVQVTKELAFDLEIAHPHWEFFMAIKTEPVNIATDIRMREVVVC